MAVPLTDWLLFLKPKNISSLHKLLFLGFWLQVCTSHTLSCPGFQKIPWLYLFDFRCTSRRPYYFQISREANRECLVKSLYKPNFINWSQIQFQSFGMLYFEWASGGRRFDTVNQNPSNSFPFSRIPSVKYYFRCYGRLCQDLAESAWNRENTLFKLVWMDAFWKGKQSYSRSQSSSLHYNSSLSIKR